MCFSIIVNILCRLYFRKKWHGCLTGQLTEEELGVSALLSQIWTNFAITGEPGHGALPWSRDRPYYLRCVAFVSYKIVYVDQFRNQ